MRTLDEKHHDVCGILHVVQHFGEEQIFFVAVLRDLVVLDDPAHKVPLALCGKLVLIYAVERDRRESHSVARVVRILRERIEVLYLLCKAEILNVSQELRQRETAKL